MKSMYELVSPDNLEANYHAKDKDDAIRYAGKLLYDSGIIEERYIDAMIRTSEMFGAYIVLLPGLAMPHARPEDGAKKVGFSLITLADPVDFGNEQHDPVKIVIAVASSGNEEHLLLMSGLSQILQDGEILRSIKEAKDRMELLHLLQAKAGSIS